MEESENKSTRNRRILIYGGLIAVIVIIFIANEIFGGTCAQVPCSATSPCVFNGVTYTTGSVCGIGEGSGCGLISNCHTVINAGTPHCDCEL